MAAQDFALQVKEFHELAHLIGISSCQQDVISPAFQFADYREKKRNVRRIVKVDPDLLGFGRLGVGASHLLIDRQRFFHYGQRGRHN